MIAWYLSEYSRVLALFFNVMIKLGNLTSASTKVSKKNGSCPPTSTVYSSTVSISIEVFFGVLSSMDGSRCFPPNLGVLRFYDITPHLKPDMWQSPSRFIHILNISHAFSDKLGYSWIFLRKSLRTELLTFSRRPSFTHSSPSWPASSSTSSSDTGPSLTINHQM